MAAERDDRPDGLDSILRAGRAWDREGWVLEPLRADGGPLAQALAVQDELEEAAQAVTDAEHEARPLPHSAEAAFHPRRAEVPGRGRGTTTIPRRGRRHPGEGSLAEFPGRGADERRPSRGLAVARDPREAAAPARLPRPRLVVRRANARGRQAPAISERAQIVMRGNVLLWPTPDEDDQRSPALSRGSGRARPPGWSRGTRTGRSSVSLGPSSGPGVCVR
jgi:hypothetical protein